MNLGCFSFWCQNMIQWWQTWKTIKFFHYLIFKHALFIFQRTFPQGVIMTTRQLLWYCQVKSCPFRKYNKPDLKIKKKFHMAGKAMENKNLAQICCHKWERELSKTYWCFVIFKLFHLSKKNSGTFKFRSNVDYEGSFFCKRLLFNLSKWIKSCEEFLFTKMEPCYKKMEVNQ